MRLKLTSIMVIPVITTINSKLNLNLT